MATLEEIMKEHNIFVNSDGELRQTYSSWPHVRHFNTENNRTNGILLSAYPTQERIFLRDVYNSVDPSIRQQIFGGFSVNSDGRVIIPNSNALGGDLWADASEVDSVMARAVQAYQNPQSNSAPVSSPPGSNTPAATGQESSFSGSYEISRGRGAQGGANTLNPAPTGSNTSADRAVNYPGTNPGWSPDDILLADSLATNSSEEINVEEILRQAGLLEKYRYGMINCYDSLVALLEQIQILIGSNETQLGAGIGCFINVLRQVETKINARIEEIRYHVEARAQQALAGTEASYQELLFTREELQDLTRQIINGNYGWGNGSDRRANLSAHGLTDAQIDEVQRQVNLNFHHGTTNADTVTLHDNPVYNTPTTRQPAPTQITDNWEVMPNTVPENNTWIGGNKSAAFQNSGLTRPEGSTNPESWYH